MTRIVHNRILGGWYVVRGPHQTPISGRFDSKADAQASLDDAKAKRDYTIATAAGAVIAQVRHVECPETSGQHEFRPYADCPDTLDGRHEFRPYTASDGEYCRWCEAEKQP